MKADTLVITSPDQLTGQLKDAVLNMSTQLLVLEGELSFTAWENYGRATEATMDMILSPAQAAQGTMLIIQLIDDVPVGLFRVFPTGIPDHGNLCLFVVDENHRGKGYGTLLLNNGISLLKHYGYNEIVMDYKVRNAPAEAFWKKNGFIPHNVICSRLL